jgi:hypothetical protein
MIKGFRHFVNEMHNTEYLMYYAFDHDDNILNMPTVIHMDKLVNGQWVPTDVSTAEFAMVRGDSENWRITNNDPVAAFSEFRDFGPRGENAFLEDVKKAVYDRKFGPSWDDFVECLSNGSLFAIITARGHESESMRMGFEWIIDNALTEKNLFDMYNNLLKFSYLYREGEYDRILKGKPSQSPLVKLYLDNCDFIGVSAPSRGGSPGNPEKAKEEALIKFKEKVNNLASRIGLHAMIGFSDDDLGNVKHIEDVVDNIKKEQFPNIIKYVVKGTKDPMNITKKVKTFNETSHQTPGLESSIMPFTQFNNMTNRLYPQGPHNRQDDYLNTRVNQNNFLVKNSSEILKTEGIKKPLPKKFVSELSNLPESGMGFHNVNIYLKNGDILRDITVLNSSIAILDSSIDVSDIIRIKISN